MNPSTVGEGVRAQYRSRLIAEGAQVHSQAEESELPVHLEDGADEQGMNVGENERWTSLAAGSIVALMGLARRDVTGLVIAGVGGALLYRGATGSCPMYQALGINSAQEQANDRRARSRFSRGVRVTQTFTIDRSPDELYSFWRRFENLPRIMTHLEEVRVLDDRRTHWVAKAPAIAGGRVEWDAETTEDIPNERISWRSIPGSELETAGSVRFERSPRGTIIRADMSYVAPGGRLGNLVAKLFGESPDRVIREDLRNFKRIMEIDEILTILGQPNGTCTGQGRLYSENNSYLMPPTV
jgi:uncharacterized membrane protein